MQVCTRGKDMIPNPHFRKTYASLSAGGRNQRTSPGRFCPPIRGKLIVSTRQSYALSYICSRRTGPKCAAASPSLQTNGVAAQLSTSPAVLDVRTRGNFMLISFTFGKLMIKTRPLAASAPDRKKGLIRALAATLWFKPGKITL